MSDQTPYRQTVEYQEARLNARLQNRATSAGARTSAVLDSAQSPLSFNREGGYLATTRHEDAGGCYMRADR